MDSKVSLHFFGDIEKKYLNKNLNKDLQGVASDFGLHFSAYLGIIRNIAGFSYDFSKFSKNISISLDVAFA